MLNEGIPKESRQRAREAFESFCLSTPWGALYHAVSPPPLRSAERMAKRLASVLQSRATREEGMEAVLRLMPVLVAEDPEFKHREKLSWPPARA